MTVTGSGLSSPSGSRPRAASAPRAARVSARGKPRRQARSRESATRRDSSSWRWNAYVSSTVLSHGSRRRPGSAAGGALTSRGAGSHSRRAFDRGSALDSPGSASEAGGSGCSGIRAADADSRSASARPSNVLRPRAASRSRPTPAGPRRRSPSAAFEVHVGVHVRAGQLARRAEHRLRPCSPGSRERAIAPQRPFSWKG